MNEVILGFFISAILAIPVCTDVIFDTIFKKECYVYCVGVIGLIVYFIL